MQNALARPRARRTVVATAALISMLALPSVGGADTIALKGLGQPGASGLIQKNFEAPFFENFAERTGLDVTMNFQPVDATGITPSEQLRVIKAGLFDIISLRLQQVSKDEPTILGLDLVGLNPTYEAAAKTAAEYEAVVDRRLQEQFNTKLLGVWPFGPQVLFCQPEISSLADLQGQKVRVFDQNLANFIAEVGGTPVPMAFAEVHQALARGVVDCAVTGPSSANSASWPEETTHVLPLAFSIAFQGYGINLDTWNKFSPEDQAKIEAAFDGLVADIWTYSAEIFEDAMRCNVGEEPCETGKLYSLVEVPVSAEDLSMVETAVKELSFPSWAELCDNANPSCSADWKATVGPRLGL